MPKRTYVVKRIVNRPDDEITYDVYLSDLEGLELVAEFIEKKDADLFARVANAKASGERFCT